VGWAGGGTSRDSWSLTAGQREESAKGGASLGDGWSWPGMTPSQAMDGARWQQRLEGRSAAHGQVMGRGALAMGEADRLMGGVGWWRCLEGRLAAHGQAMGGGGWSTSRGGNGVQSGGGDDFQSVGRSHCWAREEFKDAGTESVPSSGTPIYSSVNR
jgi:hypothetical protein